MKKNDFILASAMFIVALVWFITIKISANKGDSVSIYVNNVFIETHKLNDEGDYTLYDDNGLEIIRYKIHDASVDVIYASCPDKLCVHQKAISKDSETIVCLPNKVVIEISGIDSGDGIDAVSY